MTFPTDSLLAAARGIQTDVVDIRRRLHRRPEIGLQLPWTQRLVVEELERLGLEPRLGESITSVISTIDGAHPGPTILLRADMDALPVHENTGLDFSSEVNGAMHACGHDTHVAMLLGAARLLVERREDLAGRVLLMFQPGEEGLGGARTMLEEGLLDVPPQERGGFGPVTGAFAIHTMNRYVGGTIRLRPGALLASSDTIRITVRGRGGHASAPHLATDPIVVAAEIVTALQTAVTRQINVFDPGVITIAQIVAGTTSNIIPETAFLHGTMRAVSAATRERLVGIVRQVAEGVAAAHGAAAEVAIERGYPVTVNDAGFAVFVEGTAAELVGAEHSTTMPAPVMGAEDWSYVLERVPGAMAFLGGLGPGEVPGVAPDNHSDRVVFDEDVMPIGVALHVAVALRHLSRPGE
ncbi:MAG TPA: M20 family metallopeptidase [Candidatus Limnocylindrales bacterium]